IRGDGPIEALQPPRLAANKALADGFRLSADAPGGTVEGSRKRFSAVIRAESPDVVEIPPIEYPYFDPDRGVYAVARSTAIPITVRAAQQLAPSALEGLDAPVASDRSAARPLNGLLGIETSEAGLLASETPVRPAAVMLALAVPPALFVLAWGYLTFVHPRAADETRRRRNNAAREASNRLSRAKRLDARAQAAEVAAALRGYVADRLNEPPGRVTGRVALDMLSARGVKPETCHRYAALLEHCEHVTFSGTDDAPNTLAREAHACLAELERQRP
ncbi:MAG: BatD family protein, partial [Phycisphaerae bacterium]|nr:BatD family protein [Phycisphaerae bacterium]